MYIPLFCFFGDKVKFKFVDYIIDFDIDDNKMVINTRNGNNLSGEVVYSGIDWYLVMSMGRLLYFHESVYESLNEDHYRFEVLPVGVIDYLNLMRIK